VDAALPCLGVEDSRTIPWSSSWQAYVDLPEPAGPHMKITLPTGPG